MKKIKQSLWCVATMLFFGVSSTVMAQDNLTVTVKGTVKNAFDGKLAGIKVMSANGKNEALTNSLGEFLLPITDGSKAIVVQANGYFTETVLVDERVDADYEIALKNDVSLRDDVVELGFSREKRSQLVGAVSTVTGKELERSPVANLSQTLAGRLPGLITRETYSELSRTTTEMYSRGVNSIHGNGPIAIIDGVPISYNVNQTLEYINPTEIESISYLKDASSLAMHGIQGANGILVITTKRGVKGGLQISGRLDKSFQEATTRPIQYSSYDYATMRNQAAENDGNGANFWYTPTQMEGFKNGSNAALYPNHNWYNTFVRNWTAMERMSLNFTGGNDAVQFFSNINLMHQGGIFKTDQERYNPNANNFWVNFRSNVDMKLTNSTKGYIRLAGNVKRERTARYDVNTVYQSIFMLPPTMNGPLTPTVLDPDTGLPTSSSNQVVTTDRIDAPTYGMLNRSGFYDHTVTNIYSQFGINQDLSALTKGLSATGEFIFQTNSVGHLLANQDFERYVRTSDQENLIYQKKGAQQNTPLSYQKSGSYYYHITYKASLDYARTFGKHQVGAMGYFLYQNLTKANTDGGNMFPYNRVSTGVEATYGYDNRYFLKANMGISGSEQYAKDSRFTNTPSIGASWIVSNEEFLKNSDWLTYLKLRASYGVTANDRSGLPRFSYLDNIAVNGSANVGYLQYNIVERLTGNPYLRAEKVKMSNFGADLGFFNLINVGFDVYKQNMDNMIVSAIATVPSFQGIPLTNYPQTNSGKFENKGFEVSASISKLINKDFEFTVGGYFARNQNKVVSINESVRTSDYAYPVQVEGQAYGQGYGYKVDYSNGNGFFNTQAELDGNTIDYTMGNPRLGDLKYIDVTGDGVLDERDQTPIGTGAMPNNTFGFNGNARYKSFDLNFLFQGVGKIERVMSGAGVWETSGDGIYGSLHQHAWTPERYANGETILYPALSTVATVNHQPSDFFLYNMAYLRLKNIEIGYTLPRSISQLIRADRVRFLASGQNLLTWDKMKTSDFGPEGGSFQGIPVYRVYNLGVTVTF